MCAETKLLTRIFYLGREGVGYAKEDGLREGARNTRGGPLMAFVAFRVFCNAKESLKMINS